MIHIITTKALRTLTGERDIARAHAEKQLERARYYRSLTEKVKPQPRAANGRYVRRDPWDRYRADPIVAAALELRS